MTTFDPRKALLAGGLCLFFAAGPALSQTGRSPVRPHPGKPAPDADSMIPNACYHGIDPQNDVCLKDGRWQSEDTSAYGNPAAIVELSPLKARGDLDGDGVPETALLLIWKSGGGQLVYLAVAALRGDRIQNMATVPVGGQVHMRSLRIADGKILLGVANPGFGGGQPATRAFTLREGRLVEESR